MQVKKIQIKEPGRRSIVHRFQSVACQTESPEIASTGCQTHWSDDLRGSQEGVEEACSPNSLSSGSLRNGARIIEFNDTSLISFTSHSDNFSMALQPKIQELNYQTPLSYINRPRRNSSDTLLHSLQSADSDYFNPGNIQSNIDHIRSQIESVIS